jgi:hypothetical protein
MKYPNVFIIIVNWNGKRLLKNCLDSVFKQTYPNYEVILVDNGSTDGSVKFVEEVYAPEIKDGVLKIIVNDKNYGFAKGNNIGIVKALEDTKTKYVVTLNNDVIVRDDWLKRLIEKAQQGYDIVSSTIYFMNGRLNSVGAVLSINGLIYSRKPGEKTVLGGGASAAYSREVFENVGFFDEDFFCYNEETDLAIRAFLKNYRSGLAEKSIVWHHWGASSSEDFKVYHGHRNSVWCIVKNFPTQSLIKYSLFIMLAQLASIVLWIIRGKGKLIMKAKIDAIKGLKKMLKKRGKIQKEKSISSKEFNSLLINRWTN